VTRVSVLRDVTMFWTLTRDDRRLFLEAALLTAFVWIGLRTISFAALRRSLDGYCHRACTTSSDPLARIGWAVQAASRQIPGGRTCLLEALAADVMLRRRGYEPLLQLGVRRQNDRTQPITGHAWVVCNNCIVVGTVADLADYTALSAPAIRSR
jgi:hypothetical protein